jgi:ATP-dependent Clp protease adaptor protein ClpS
MAMTVKCLALSALISMLPLVSAFHGPSALLPSVASNLAADSNRASYARPALRAARMQLDAPEKISIPDSFNPAEWAKRGGGLGGGGGGFKIPDSFNPADLEREKEKTNVAVMDRPVEKLDPGKKYRVLLFNDENNTREYVIEVLMKYIPDMSADMAKEITARAHNTGMAIVGIWMYELAEGYMDILRSNGLKSDIEAD